jgi:hypothetical protein
MASITAKATGGNWTVGSTWVGDVAPLASDDVIIDGTSGNITIDSGAVARSVDFNGYSGLCIHNANVTLNIGDGTAGAGNRALRMSPTMTYLKMHPQTSAIAFISTSATQQTIDWCSTTGNHTFGHTTYNASSNGSWLWNDDFISSFAGLNATLTLTKGTLNTNGKTFIGGQVTGSNSNVRTLTMGASQFYCYGVGNNCWLFATITSLTVTANTAKVWFYRSLTCFAPLIQSGTVNWNGLDLEWIGGGICTIASGGVPIFDNVTVNGGQDLGDGREDRLQQNNSWTANGTVTFNGLSQTRRLRVHSNGGVRTVTVAGGSSVTGKYVDFQNTSLSVSNNLSAIVGGAGDLGGNTNIVFASAVPKYFYSPTPGVKFYNDDTLWFLGTGGTGGQTTRPLAQDDAIFDLNSFPVAGVTVRNGVGCNQLGKNINWTGVTNNPVWDFQVDVINYGSLTLDPNMTVTSYSDAFFTMFGSGASQFFTVDFAGLQLPHTLFLINFASTNTCTLQSHFVGNALNTTLFQTTGLIDFNNKNVTTGRFQQSSGTITMGAGIFTLKGVGTIWNCAGTVNANTSEIIVDSQNVTAKTFTGGTKTYNKLTLQGNYNDTLTFSGNNSFGNTSITKTSAFSLVFTTGSTTTFTGTVTKTTGSLWNLMSTTSTAFTWSKASGSITFVDAIISKSTASGGATFTANTNSIDGGGNSGWAGFVTNPFTWTGAVDGDVSRGANWFGGSQPTTNDVAYFTGAFNINASITDIFASLNNWKGMVVTLGYTGTINSVIGTWSLGTEGLIISGGTISGMPNTSFTNNGKFRMTGGTFTPSNNWIQVSQGSTVETVFINGGTYSHANGTFTLTGSSDAILTNTSARQFYNFTTSSFTGKISGTFFVDNSFTLTTQEFNGDVSCKLSITTGALTGTGIIRITGTTMTLNATEVPQLQFNCTGTVTLSADVIVNSTLTLTAVPTVNGNTVRCKGNISTAVTTIAGTTNTSIEGTLYEQSITGAGVLIGSATINKTNGLVKLSSHMTPVDLTENFTVTQGQFNTNEYNVVFSNNLTVSEASGGLYFETMNSSTQVNGTLSGRKIKRQKLYAGIATI